MASEDSVDEAASRAGRPAAEELAETRPDPHRVRIYALNLVNRHPVEVVVMASAGAGRVVLDTVASMDSARVDIRLRADRVRLEATDAAGRTLATSEIALIPDTVQRWVARPRQRGETTGD